MTVPAHRFIFILLIFLSIPSTSTAQKVTIPDSNLRAAIAAELGKASGDPITTSDVAALRSLTARESNISNLTGLEHAINLTSLDLGRNSISDITSLSGLTNLNVLYFGDNLISDISAISGLINLKWLGLGNNSVSDISALVENTELAGSDKVHIRGNPLSYLSIHTHLPTLQSRGVTVEFDSQAHPTLLKISGDNQEGMPSEDSKQVVIDAAVLSCYASVLHLKSGGVHNV